MKRYNVSANRYNDSETIITVHTGTRVRAQAAGTRAAGTRVRVRVRVQQIFSKKKTDRPFSNPYPCTRLPAYTRAWVRIPRVPDTDIRIRIVPDGF
jgi:hypothetical protein